MAKTEARPAGTARIVLHGHLRRQFGTHYDLGVTSPANAIYALCKMVPGFRPALEAGNYRVRRGKFRKGVDLPVQGLALKLAPGGEMHLIPTAAGSKSGMGIAKIIAGVVLVVAATLLVQPEVYGALPGLYGAGAEAGSLGLSTSLVGGMTIGSVMLAGGAMILTGIIQLLSPQPKNYSRPEGNYLLGGLTNVVTQGGPLPLVYGTMRVGSVVISAGYQADDFSPSWYIPPIGEDFPAGGSTPTGNMTQASGSTGVPGTTAGATLPNSVSSGGIVNQEGIADVVGHAAFSVFTTGHAETMQDPDNADIVFANHQFAITGVTATVDAGTITVTVGAGSEQSESLTFGPTDTALVGFATPFVIAAYGTSKTLDAKIVSHTGSPTSATIHIYGSFLGISGSGGSGKGASGGTSPGMVVAPDTLYSNATVRVVEAIGEGPIGGLVDGAKSIFFNDTPLQGSDGTYNFRGVNWALRFGLPTQDPISGFPDSESSEALGVQVKRNLGDPPGSYTHQITGAGLTAARVTMRIPTLYSTDQTTGDVSPANVAWKIEVQPSKESTPGWTGSYIQVAYIDIGMQKTMTQYQKSTRFDLPTTGGADTWNVRVTRITPDSTNVTFLQNDLWWDSIDSISDYRLEYPNTAYIALEVDARLFGSSVPVRHYEIYGRTINVPANYNPGTRTYASSGPGTSSGTWDMVSFIQRPSNNPAWILLDLLQNPRYGAGVKTAYLQRILADLYVIAQYCDEMVPDGFGGTEPRYECDCAISQQDEAYRVLQLVVSAFRGMSYWGAGQVLVTADMPQEPTKLINQTNVQDGRFEYSGTSLKTRPNLIRVGYLDKHNRYIQTVEPVYDTADIAMRGAFPSDLIAFGCTHRSLAHRLGKWALFTAKYQTQTVTFKGGPYLMDIVPGMVIDIADPAYAGARMGGRLKPITVPQGVNRIANSVAPTLTPQSPNTAVSSTDVPPQVWGVAVSTHDHLGDTSTTNCGALTLTLGAGYYWLSCFVWVPGGCIATAVQLHSSVDPIVALSALTLAELPFRLDDLPTPAILEIGGADSPPTNSADMTNQGAWQRLYSLVHLTGSTSLTVSLEVGGPAGGIVYSTCWSIDDTGFHDFVPTSGGAVSLRQVALDQVYGGDGSSTYTLSTVMPNGTLDLNNPIQHFATVGTGDSAYTMVGLERALPAVPNPNAEWIVTSSNVSPRQFQVLSLAEEQRGLFAITAVNYYPGKFGNIEEGFALDTPTFSTLPAQLVDTLTPPDHVRAVDYVRGFGASQTLMVSISWAAPLDPRISRYDVLISGPNIFRIVPATGVTLDVDSLQVGTDYTFGVRSVSFNGQTSPWSYAPAPVTITGSITQPVAPATLVAVGGTRLVKLHWDAIANRGDIQSYEVWRASTALSDPTAGGSFLVSVGATSWTDTDSVTLTPNSTWYYWVRGVASGSPAVKGLFVGPTSATTTLLIAADLDAAIYATALAAQNIFQIGRIASTGTPGTTVNELAWAVAAYGPQPSGLYKWDGTVWVSAANPSQGFYDAIGAAIGSFGGVRANEVDAGTIHAAQLASDFALISSAQIGTATIAHANIGDLAVETSNIQTRSVTETTSSYFNDTPAYMYSTGWVDAAAISINVPTYGKVLFLSNFMGAGTDAATPPTPSDSGGGGGEGGGGGF